MIHSVQAFVDYFAGVRRRTLNYAHIVPTEHVNWSPRPGKFTCADILRHIASTEKMFVGVVAHGNWKYEGHSGDQRNIEELIAHLGRTHDDAMKTLRSLPDSALAQPRPALEGNVPVKGWRWLMAMTEHEIHHRSQLAMYLLLLGVTGPRTSTAWAWRI